MEFRYGTSTTDFDHMALTGMIFDFEKADEIAVKFTFNDMKLQPYTKQRDFQTVWKASTPFQFDVSFDIYRKSVMPTVYNGWLARYVQDKHHMNLLVQTAQMIVHQRQLNDMRTTLEPRNAFVSSVD